MTNERDQDAQCLRKATDYIDKEQYEEAFRLYLQLAERGDWECQRYVGWMYFMGKGTTRNLDAAERWMTEAAKTGDERAAFYLGKIFFRKNELSKSMEWYEAAADKNFAPAIFRLGLIYDKGTGVDADKKRGTAMFQRASEMGHLFARKEFAKKLMAGERGVAGTFAGFFIFLWNVFAAIKVAARDPEDDRLLF